jgi:hypothetical protein
MARQRSRRARPETRPAPSPGLNRAERRLRTVNRPAKHTFSVTFPHLVGKPHRVIVHTTQTWPWLRKARNRRRERIAAASRRANRGSR